MNRCSAPDPARLRREREDGRCLVGLKLVAISSLRLNNLELKTEAAALAAPPGRQSRSAGFTWRSATATNRLHEKIERSFDPHVFPDRQSHCPLHCTALGKVLLAPWTTPGHGPAAAARLLPHRLRTTTDPARLLDEIRHVAKLRRLRRESTCGCLLRGLARSSTTAARSSRPSAPPAAGTTIST